MTCFETQWKRTKKGKGMCKNSFFLNFKFVIAQNINLIYLHIILPDHFGDKDSHVRQIWCYRKNHGQGIFKQDLKISKPWSSWIYYKLNVAQLKYKLSLLLYLNMTIIEKLETKELNSLNIRRKQEAHGPNRSPEQKFPYKIYWSNFL